MKTILFMLSVLIAPMANSFTIDTSTSASPMTGMWWNANESGWGASITQQYDVIFATMYVYDSSGAATWYVVSNCAISGGGCSGSLLKATGGASPVTTWNGANIAVSAVGNIAFNFTDANTGTMNYSINGVSGSKSIARQVFRNPPPATTGLVWSTPLSTGGYSWFQANAYCASGSAQGWRLPTQPELSTYISSLKGKDYGAVWSSTPAPGVTSHYVVISSGAAVAYSDGNYFEIVLCVH